ncbi:MAG: type II secretion system protein GspD [Candidatus Omnitrophica bacterium]|nr:type II secretion system protein GspD [Candidatus Omnitrophota bacterium]
MRIKRVVSWILFLALVFSMPVPAAFSETNDDFAPAAEVTEDTFSNFGGGESAPMPESVAVSGTADRITLELKGVNVLDVLKILAKRSGLNIVAGRDVRGDVTLYMQDVGVRQALDTIVRTLGLAYDEKDGIITVMSHKEYVSRYGKPFQDERINEVFKLNYASAVNMNQLVQQMKSQIGKIAVDEKTATIVVTDIPEVMAEIRQVVKEFDRPLATKTYTLKYGKAADIGEDLKDYLTQNVGVIKIDKRANQITVTDREAVVDQILGIIEEFDKRPKQVLIEAKVVEVQLYDAFRFGVDWNYVDLKVGRVDNISLKPAQSVSAPGSKLGSGSLSTFTIGTSAGNDTLQTVINILSNVGKTNILSSPRLMCLNNEEAKLAVATKQPYVTQTVNVGVNTSNTADDVKFIDVGVTMTIVPTITHDNNIILKIKPEVSTKASSDFEIEGVAQSSDTKFIRTKVPIVTTQTLETTVIVKDGTTVVIGGLIQDQEAKLRKKLPVLGDIPFLGAAFRTETNDFNKTELVFFLTPQIISGKANTLEEEKYLDNKEGDFMPFNKVGGYDFTKAETTTSQGAFRMDDKPYYESLVEERPVYFPPRDTAIRAAEYRDKYNLLEPEPVEAAPQKESVSAWQAKKFPVSQPEEISQPTTGPFQARREYREKVAVAIQNALGLRQDLGSYPIEVELFLVIEKDGKLTLKRLVKDKGLSPSGRALVLDTVSKLSPFPAFPAEMKSSEELLDLKIELS